MHLKESAYNFIYDDLGKDQIVFYNSRTGALAVVHEDQYKQYKGFQEKGKEIEDAEFLKNLLKCGYLLPAEVDEKFLIKTNMMQGRYNKNLLSLTIAPTMACNFRCIYCFEKGHYGNSLMDGETQIALMNFIKSHLDGVKNINVTWFGGEPLLGMSVIESLSEQIIALCEEKELQYQAGIITNGYLLTPENAEKLKKYNVRYAQVTVDGPKEIHNERRPTVNGQGTYDVIMNNLKSICGILHVHFPFSSMARMVSMKWQWGLCPGGSGSWIAKSQHIPFETNCSSQYSLTICGNSSIGTSLGRAATNRLASCEFHCFSISSTEFQRVARSAYSGGAFGGSMISV